MEQEKPPLVVEDLIRCGAVVNMLIMFGAHAALKWHDMPQAAGLCTLALVLTLDATSPVFGGLGRMRWLIYLLMLVAAVEVARVWLAP